MTWPSDRAAKSSTFQICIIGKDPFGATLDSMVSSESIGGKKIKVQRLTAVRQAQSCMMLFVSSSEKNHLPTILRVAHNYSLLTVSDVDSFAERGGDIGLVLQQKHVRFEVNCAAAEQQHLIVSSELLKVAVRVISNR